MYLNNLFVYGTLLPGLKNYKRFIESHNHKVYEARAKGVMYLVPGDGYPVVLDGEGVVKGVLYETRDLSVILPEIDEIEKYTDVESQSLLTREIRDVELLELGKTVKAHMYMWPPPKAQWLKENGEVIPDGDWARFLRENK
ncbi:MAG: gamma-glutamylcyclotransferase family protein [Desulfotomaculaceae bacterium]